ncbi:MAG: sigma-54 dependent transcriptional regulator, partial [Spirochaetes bacterium]|nr:sigma-54 dependent transcriptional regulator [Spirochaetota bacterium]
IYKKDQKIAEDYQHLAMKYEEILKKSGFLNEKIIGVNGGLKDVFHQVEHISHTDECILITGETGTGKEVIARTIHSLSKRKAEPFIKINCGAIPDNLLESELFGYKKGAFTGAIESKPGKIELANQGTLFLDEIGELKTDLQSSLLQVIQEKKVERLGSNSTIPVDFRLICATNQDLTTLIEQKLFREDLYYRINTFNINIPPLRQRQEDLSALIDYLLAKYSNEMDIPKLAIEEKTISFLSTYHWPGNIRELENVVKRAVILNAKKKKTLQTKDFHYLKQTKNNHFENIDNAMEVITQKIIKNEFEFKNLEKMVIQNILTHYQGNIMDAVRQTRIPKDRFYRIR